MFIDQEGQKQSEKEMATQESGSFFDSKKNILIISLVLLFVFLIIVGSIIYFAIIAKQPPSPSFDPNEEQPLATTSLPIVEWPIDPGENNSNGTVITDINGETLSFGNFYKKNDFKTNYTFTDYELPINVKTDVVNYYDISRRIKIDLDDYVDDLNKNGFVMVENPFSKEANDFYGLYSYFQAQNIPFFITTDFLLYYQQNVFKKAFKEIEAIVFYENLQSINHEMYKIAKERYERLLSQKGVVNDPVLEGARKELVYFAVALKLMEPKEDQIKEEAPSPGAAHFTPTEGLKYKVYFPSYLQGQVNAEYELIKQANSVSRSPVFLYERNYNDFKVPAGYSQNARLNNFYLASVWAKSLFPLYYKGDLCPDCLLDIDDWRINMIAASFIAQDFAKNQDVKNKWAVIYKIISFFEGLRSDLNYLHYEDKLTQLFGAEADIENIFSSENGDREENFLKFQKELINIGFFEVEGAYNRENSKELAKIGLRFLAESYWPDKYIFKQLNSPNSGEYLEEPRQSRTICRRTKERCSGIGLDVVNIIYPIANNQYFEINSKYDNYQNQVDLLKSQIDKFTVHSWNNNNFWSNMDIMNQYLNYDKSKLPAFVRSNAWKEKEINTALGSWVNLQLPIDKLSFSQEITKDTTGLGFVSEMNEFNYIEPNLEIIQEFRAKTSMLRNMFLALGAVNEISPISINLREAEKNFQEIENIALKALNGEEFNENDHKILEDFVNLFSVSEAASKELVLTFDSPDENVYRRWININGLKIAVIVYQIGDKKALAFGPIFNYQEK